MKETRKKEYAEKRIRKQSAQEKADKKLADFKEKEHKNGKKWIRIDARTWKEVKL